MSLADQLLDYSSDEEIEVDNDVVSEEEGEGVPSLNNVKLNLTTIKDITKISKLKLRLDPIMEQIDKDTEYDYDFIILANSFTQEIINEVATVHNYIKIHYNAIFPELSSLVPSAIDYSRTVKLLGDNILANISLKEEELKQVLPKEKLLVITMSSSLKQSNYETPDITNIIKACDLVIILNEYQQRIMDFVSSNLNKFAPNLSNLIGPYTTAQLISSVGSLQNLATTPSCNLLLLGNKRQMGVGYGGSGIRMQGYLYENPLIQNVPDEYKKQLLRILSGKIILAARVDLSRSNNDGSLGLNYKEEVLTKLDKLMQPPDQLKVKLLPVPIDQKSKKRGGKRFSKMKKNFQSSDLQKLQNKMSFGEREESYMDSFGNEIGLGMAARSNNGSLRMQVASNSGAKAKMSKKMANRLELSNVNDDLLSFDNPDLQKPKLIENGRWFEDANLTRKRATDDLEARILKKLKKN